MKSQVLKDMAAVFVIVILLPYVLTMIFGSVTKGKHQVTELPEDVVEVEYDERKEVWTMEEYLIGVLAAQIDINSHPEALKVQAIMARTGYAIHKDDENMFIQEETSQHFLTQNQMKELWQKDYEKNYNLLKQAVADTGNLCMYSNETLAEPLFHAVSAGYTRNGSSILKGEAYGYVSSVACEPDLLAENHVTIKTFTKEELYQLYVQLTQNIGENVSQTAVETIHDPETFFQVKKRDETGYILSLSVGTHEISGERFRNMFMLPSSCFEIERWGEGLRFVCKGLGHGLGVSLHTANIMAQEGADYLKILNYFFKDIQIKNNSSICE